MPVTRAMTRRRSHSTAFGTVSRRNIGTQTSPWVTAARFGGQLVRHGVSAYRSYRNIRGAYRSITRQSDNADGAPANATSTYKQFAVGYKSKKYGRRQRRQKKQLQRFKYCWSKLQGLKSLTLTNRAIIGTTDNTQKIDGVIALNGLSNHTGADYGFADIAKIKDVVLGSNPTAQKQRFMINKIVVDMWVKNVSDTLAFVDLYEYVLRKDLEADLGTTLNTVFTNIYNNTLRVTGTQELLTNLGWSPFEVSEICKKFKIIKVNRLQIPPGGNMSFHKIFKQRYVPMVEDLIAGGTSPFTGRRYRMRGWFARVAGDQTPLLDAKTTQVSFLTRRTYFYSTLFDSYNDQGFTTPSVP